MRKSYSGLAVAVTLSILLSGCDNKKVQTKIQEKVEPTQVKTVVNPVPVEVKNRFALKKEIADCLQVREVGVTEPLERYLSDAIFDPQGVNDNQQFILVIKKLIEDEIKLQKDKLPITDEALDYESLILEKSYSNLMKRFLSKVAISNEDMIKKSNKDVFSKIMTEFSNGKAVNSSVQACLNIFKNYDLDAYNHFMSTTNNERVKVVGVQQIPSNGSYSDDNGVKRNTWSFLTKAGQIEIQEKPFKILFGGEIQDFPLMDDKWKNQNKLWSNLDRLWVEQVFTNEDELYVVLSPDINALGIAPQVYNREVFVFSLDAKIRDRFSYKYPFDLKGSEEITVTPKGFESKTKESDKNGIFSVVYEGGKLNLTQLAVAKTIGSTKSKCTQLFEDIYINDTHFKSGLEYGHIPSLPEQLLPIISDKLNSNIELKKKFFYEVSNKTLADKLNAPKDLFEAKYCD